MNFEWDENKNKQNNDKHDIDFNEAKEIFEDEDRINYPDERKDYGEKRWITIGKVLDFIYTVVYTLRSGVVRIISARRANKKERDWYNNRVKKNKNE